MGKHEEAIAPQADTRKVEKWTKNSRKRSAGTFELKENLNHYL